MNAGVGVKHIIKNYWTIDYFYHKITTPIPSKPKYSMPKDYI
ncbi:unnamed protein product [Brassica rapa subsp. trilocularis]